MSTPMLASSTPALASATNSPNSIKRGSAIVPPRLSIPPPPPQRSFVVAELDAMPPPPPPETAIELVALDTSSKADPNDDAVLAETRLEGNEVPREAVAIDVVQHKRIREISEQGKDEASSSFAETTLDGSVTDGIVIFSHDDDDQNESEQDVSGARLDASAIIVSLYIYLYMYKKGRILLFNYRAIYCGVGREREEGG